jgi:cytidine deaminase
VVCALHSGGGGRLAALSCVDGAGTTLMPCGRCRQLLLEHGGPEMLIDHPAGPRPLADLLPDAFGPDDLARLESR